MARNKKPKQDPPPAPREERPAAYFLSLSLENIRCFGKKQTLDLSDGQGKHAKWTVLLGENGTGKTTVLQALAAFWVSLYDSMINSKKTQRHSLLPNYHFRGLRRSGQSAGCVYAVLADGFTSRLRTIAAQHHVKALPQMDATEFDGGGKNPGCLPLFAYESTRRLTELNQPKSYHPAPGRFIGLFDPNFYPENPSKYLINLDHNIKIDNQNRKLKNCFEKINNLLKKLLPNVNGIQIASAEQWSNEPVLLFETNDGPVPLHLLGNGYQSTTVWVLDLVTGLIEHYPDSPNPLAEPVIVLVDEIELHLHPRWQRKLMEDLDRFFPNAQFIVTTHSPLVVQAAPNANVAVLRREGDHVKIDDQLDAIRNWRVDQILTSELFGGISPYPPEQEKILERRAELLQKKKKTPAEEKELQQLEEQARRIPSGSTPEQVRIFEELRKTLDILKQHTPKP